MAMTVETEIRRSLDKTLRPGEAIRYWQIGALQEDRFDTPDTPMQGEMDPFFFLTKHKNFIPHEYPCRTEFAARHRGKRPDVRGEFAPARWWLRFATACWWLPLKTPDRHALWGGWNGLPPSRGKTDRAAVR